MALILTASDILPLVDACLAMLKKHEAEINKLNVFPVPDGDTGTNMVLTMRSVVVEVNKLSSPTLPELAQAISYGSLTGARGNSGVILSQIIRGVCETVASTENEEITPAVLSEALQNGAKVAYKAIRKPVEGTILTVVREAAGAVRKVKNDQDIETVVETALHRARQALLKTPELLPVLKEAGVVDAGGYGLVALIEGAFSYLKGEEITEVEAMAYTVPLATLEEESLEYAYCTEFLLKSEEIDIPSFEDTLDKLGNSVMVVGSGGVTRIHVHTNSPGKVLEMATSLGSISQVQINNMLEQTEERSRQLAEESALPSKIGLVAVATGEGVKEIMKSLGVSRIVNGGQTMNPSAQELVAMIDDVPSASVIVLPNNRNIILTAEQASTLTTKPVAVLPTRTIPEAFSALLAFNEDKSLEDNIKLMEKAISQVKSGEVTIAVRDSKSKTGKVKKGEYIGITDHEVRFSGSDFIETSTRMIDSMVDENAENIMLITGSDVSEGEAERLKAAIEKACHHCEIELHQGGQPLYHLLVSVE